MKANFLELPGMAVHRTNGRLGSKDIWPMKGKKNFRCSFLDQTLCSGIPEYKSRMIQLIPSANDEVMLGSL